MREQSEPVRVHVHWAMKVIAILEIIISPFLVYDNWQRGLIVTSVALGLFTLLAIWVFFLADTKIDVDQEALQITAPHGVYRMTWAEIQSVEQKGQSAYFFGENKAIAYNLLLAGKGKLEFQRYVADVIRQRAIPSGRPTGITNAHIQKMFKNTKVRGWKLF